MAPTAMLIGSKRKPDEPEVDQDGDEGMEDDGSDVSLINVDFDFFTPTLDVDQIALKRLLKQLLSTDADKFDLHALSELILTTSEADGVGSCIKVDGKESDPFSFLAVLNLNVHRESPALAPLITYLIQKCSNNKNMQALLTSLVALPSTSTGPHVGLIISERLVNMPVQTVPPLYRFLGEEIEAAKAAGKAYNFSHYILLSRQYIEPTVSSFEAPGEASSLMETGIKKPKKSKKAQAKEEAARLQAAEMEDDSNGNVLQPFHPEESLMARFSLFTQTYQLSPPRKADDELEFGVDQRGHIMLLDGSKWAEMVKVLEEGCV